MPTYPTKEQILQEPRTKHRRDVLAYVRGWKETNWVPARAGDDRSRFEAIKTLILRIATLYGAAVRVEWVPNGNGGSSFCVPSTGLIVLIGRPSIITGLHELAHALFGRSERRACRWSVWLFRKTFPLAYARLAWNGHLLVRPR